MLERPNTWKEVLIRIYLYQPKASTAVGKHSFNFVQKAEQVLTVDQASEKLNSIQFSFNLNSPKH